MSAKKQNKTPTSTNNEDEAIKEKKVSYKEPDFFSYIPHARQALFHQDNHKVKWYLSGYGGGKTTAGVYEAIYFALVKYPGRTGLMVAPTYPQLTDTLWTTFQKLCPINEFGWKKNEHRFEVKFPDHLGGSTILFRSSYDPDRIEGINASWCVFDECALEPNEDIFNKLLGRCRIPSETGEPPQIVLTSTPNGAGHWTARIMGTSPVSEGCKGNASYWIKDNQYAVIKSRTVDNPAPFIKDYVKQLESRPDASPEWLAQVLEGEFVSQQGRVFKQFNYKRHVAPRLTITKPPAYTKNIHENHWEFYIGVDIGYAAPGTMIVVGKDKFNNFRIVHEEYHKNLTFDEKGWFIIADKLRRAYNPKWFVMDSASPDAIVRLRNYWNNKMMIMGADKRDRMGSIRRLQKLLGEQDKRQNERFQVYQLCPNTIQELQSWSWKVDKRLGPLDEPQDGMDHCIDAILYVLTDALTFKNINSK